jgi:hypothetical protein
MFSSLVKRAFISQWARGQKFGNHLLQVKCLLFAHKHLLRMGWRNIFPVVLLCQFFVVAEIVLGDAYLPYQLCRCVFFLLQREIVLGCTGRFFGCGGK